MKQDEWTVDKYILEVLMQFRDWTLWILKRHTVTMHHVNKVNNDMFNHMDGMMRALTDKKTPWKDDLYIAVKLAQQ